jgi:hypothetical protein
MPRGKVPKVTPRDLDALRVITEFWGSHGRAPTLREIGAGTGTTHGVANTHVQALLAAGLLKRNRDGKLVTPGQKVSPTSLARVFDIAEDEWVPAPEPGLIAWRANCARYGVEVGDLVFCGDSRAHKGDLVIIQGDDVATQPYLISEPMTRRKRPLTDTAKLATGETVEIFPAHWLLRKVVPRRQRAKDKPTTQG